MAYEIVEQIVLMTCEGKWKKVSRRKKFKEQFGNEEDAFDDHFKIGLSIKYNMKSQQSSLRLFEEFYDSDIIVASPLAIRIVTGQETDENA